ncbi:inner centromere protein A isoform X1 [Anarrhichthys ocellatus]|uniref:inner centromere protein A isoform X1 n=1 Tax=Anarrhichthys ocellatus TaxID=433405 RepID=UPI0012ED7E22|nr:inner centromere protein isoform X1 [Anarrhichthys ocellatus]XP_031719948.1 inner centromere protein isoform X1 [Anarrhichthys ocellatus]
MNSVRSSVRSLKQHFDGKVKEFTDEIETVHMVWLVEIQQEANRMFSGDFIAEPELMPKTPSQKKHSRRKRVSMGHQEEHQARRRFSKGRRSNLRGSSVKSLNFIAEEETFPNASTSDVDTTTARPKRTTRKNKQTVSEAAEDASQSCGSLKTEEEQNKKPEQVEEEEMAKDNKVNDAEDEPDPAPAPPPPTIPSPEIVVSISSSDRLSAERANNPLPSPGRTAAKIAIAGAARSSRRSSMRCSLKLRHSLAGLRHSMTQESVRRASRRSMLKRKGARMGNSTCSSNVDDDSCVDSTEEEEEDRAVMLDAVSANSEDNAAAEEWKETPEINQSFRPSVGRITRSVAANSATLAPPSTVNTPNKGTVIEKQLTSQSGRMSRQSTKRKAPDTVEESPTKRPSPPKKNQSTIRPNMRSFLHTVQKNQMLMMTPNSLGRTAVMKSFIKHTTPLRIDPKLSVGIVTKERYKLEALKKKQELEEERMKKMDEEKKRKQDDLKRKRDERLRRVFEAKVKEEQREVEKKKKIEQKMAQIDEKNDKRVAEDKAKKKVAIKRQDDLEQKRKLEEDAKRKKIQQAEEEKRQQELLATKKAEEEEQRARKLAEARRALEQKREQERELERERLAVAERERVEKAKALALQQEVERAAREKERRELEEKRKALDKRLEEQRRLAAKEQEVAAKEREAAAKEREAAAKEREVAAKKAASAKAASCLNVTVDIERSVMGTPVGKGADLNKTLDVVRSPQSYSITPKGGNKPLPKCGDDYGMDQNSDDSTDDESAPRKPIPSWAEGPNLQQIMMKQYFNPPDIDTFFGTIEPPKLENIFYKSKPRYFKRTSSAVWHSPPIGGK